jgi:asparagine N-glycosylation enzyme membrane subunit Stt3
MSPEEGQWILFFAAIAWLTHAVKIVVLYILLWRTRNNGQRQPIQFLAFMFLLVFLVLLPYQDQKASKAVNRTLMIATVLQYTSWVALAYIILINR